MNDIYNDYFLSTVLQGDAARKADDIYYAHQDAIRQNAWIETMNVLRQDNDEGLNNHEEK